MQSHTPGGDTDTRALFKLAVGLSLAFLFVFLYGSELPVAPIVVIIEFCKMVTELTHADLFRIPVVGRAREIL